MSHFESCLMGRVLLLGEGQPCCPIQALNGLNETHTYQGGQSMDFNVNLTQKYPYETPRVMFNQISWHPIAYSS